MTPACREEGRHRGRTTPEHELESPDDPAAPPPPAPPPAHARPPGRPGATGLKTGWTPAAGRCLVATAERGGVRLGVVLLNSSEPGRQAEVLLNRGFAKVYGQPRVASPPLPPGA